MNSPPKRWTHWLFAAAKLILFLLLCWFIYHAFASDNQKLNEQSWHVELEWLLLSGVLYLLGMFPPAVFWHRVMRRAGQDIKFGEAMRAYYVSQLGKYVPGKWMVILLRRMMLQTKAVENTVVAATVFFETLTMLAVGAATAVVLLGIWHRHLTFWIAVGVGSMFLLGLPTVPRYFRWLIRILGVDRLNPTTGNRFRQMEWRTMLVGWATIAVGWLLQGLSLWATLRGVGATATGPFEDLSLNTSAVSLAVVAGFISQIPAGLAVREWVFGELLGPSCGASAAMISAIVFRLVLLVSELVISIILYLAGWRRLRKPSVTVDSGLSVSAAR